MNDLFKKKDQIEETLENLSDFEIEESMRESIKEQIKFFDSEFYN